MNYLAHFYLSFNNPKLLIGNYIADSVKGKKYQAYETEIQTGILLHRFIDSFTDDHAISKEITKKLHPYLGKFSGIALDVFYDYELARNFHDWHVTSLNEFSTTSQSTLIKHYDLLPHGSQRFLHYMQQNNLPLNYSDFNMIKQVFNGLHHRFPLKNNLNESPNHYTKIEKLLNSNFHEFLSDLKSASKEFLLKNHPETIG